MILLFTIHALNYISAVLQILMGILILKRNRNNHISQLLAGTFFGLAGYEFFDGLVITIQLDFPGWLDITRDFSIISLILGAEFAFLAVLLVMYGEQRVYNQVNFIFWFFLTIILLFLGLTGDHIVNWGPNKENGFHLDIYRSLVGWITITGTLITLSVITLFIFFIQIKNSRGNFRRKILFFVFGYTLILINILIFDLAVFIELLNSVIANNSLIHLMIHFLLILGEIFVISSSLFPLSTDHPFKNLKIEKKFEDTRKY